jgi:hypothetical protein
VYVRVAHFTQDQCGCGVIGFWASAFFGARPFCLITLVVVLFGGVACNKHQATPGFAIDTAFSPEPARIGRESVTVRMKDSAARPVTGAHLMVEGNMSHAGMAPVFGEGKEIEPGRYEANLDLSMRGSWVISLHVRLASGEKIERQIPIEVKAE